LTEPQSDEASISVDAIPIKEFVLTRKGKMSKSMYSRFGRANPSVYLSQNPSKGILRPRELSGSTERPVSKSVLSFRKKTLTP